MFTYTCRRRHTTCCVYKHIYALIVLFTHKNNHNKPQTYCTACLLIVTMNYFSITINKSTLN